MTININREELAWAAGFFDGEGTTGTYGSRVAQLNLSLPQKNRAPLDRFRIAINDLGSIYQTSTTGMWQWRSNSFEHGQAVLAMLWPFLCDIKKAQAAAALIKYHQYKVRRNHKRRSINEILASDNATERLSATVPNWVVNAGYELLAEAHIRQSPANLIRFAIGRSIGIPEDWLPNFAEPNRGPKPEYLQAKIDDFLASIDTEEVDA